MAKVKENSLIMDLKGVDESQVSQDIMNGVYHAVQTRLSDREKFVILRYYTDQKTYAEIAEEGGFSISNARERKRKSLIKLKNSGYVKYGLKGYEQKVKDDRERWIKAIKDGHPEEVDIINLDLPVAIYHRLWRGDVKTLADLKNSVDTLRKCGLGAERIFMVCDKVNALGYAMY